KLHEPVGISQPAHRAVHDMAGRVSQSRGDIRIDQNVELHGCIADDRRAHQPENMANTFMPRVPAWPPGESGAPDRGELKHELRRPADQYPESHPTHRADSERWAEPITEREPR